MIIDSLKLRSSKLCEIGKSSRAATSRDRVLSSGISNRPLVKLLATTPDRLLESLDFALSKWKTRHVATRFDGVGSGVFHLFMREN